MANEQMSTGSAVAVGAIAFAVLIGGAVLLFTNVGDASVPTTGPPGSDVGVPFNQGVPLTFTCRFERRTIPSVAPVGDDLLPREVWLDQQRLWCQRRDGEWVASSNWETIAVRPKANGSNGNNLWNRWGAS